MLPIIIENKRSKIQVEWKKLISTLLDFGINVAVGNPKGTGKLLENLGDAFSTSLSNERLAFLLIFKPVFYALNRTIQELQKHDVEITARLRQVNPYFELEKNISQYLTEEGYVLDQSFFDEDLIQNRYNHPLVAGTKRIIREWLSIDTQIQKNTLVEFDRAFNMHYVDSLIDCLGKDDDLRTFHGRIENYLSNNKRFGNERLLKLRKLKEDIYPKLFKRELFNNNNQGSLAEFYVSHNYTLLEPSRKTRSNLQGYIRTELKKKNKKGIYVILGFPGQGKSSFAYMFLQSYLGQMYEEPVYFLDCSHFYEEFTKDPTGEIKSYIERRYSIEDKSKCIWLLDGLDEVENIAAATERTISKIYSSKPANVVVIVTCRNGFIDIYSDKIKPKNDIEFIHLSPLDLIQQKSLVKLFQEKRGTTLNNTYLLDIIESGGSEVNEVKEIYQNPNFLTLILHHDIDARMMEGRKVALFNEVFVSMFEEIIKKNKKDTTHQAFYDVEREDWILFIEECAFLLDQYSDVSEKNFNKLVVERLNNHKMIDRAQKKKIKVSKILKTSINIESFKTSDGTYIIRFQNKAIQEYLCAMKIYRELLTLVSRSYSSVEILSLFQRLFGYKKHVKVIWDYLTELFSATETRKRLKDVLVSSQLLKYFIDHQGLKYYDASTSGELGFLAQPINKAINTFYGYWKVATLVSDVALDVPVGYHAKLMNCLRFIIGSVNMENIYLGQIDWTSIPEIKGANFSNVDFSNANLSGIKFSNCDFRNARFEYTNLDNTVFESCNLSFTIIGGQTSPDAELTLDLLNCQMYKSEIKDILLTGGKIANTRVFQSEVNRVRFEGLIIRKTEFVGTAFIGVKIADSLVEDSMIRDSTLVDVQFLSRTSLQSSSLVRCSFENPIIAGTDFSFVRITDSKGLKGQDLVNCTSLFNAQLDKGISRFFQDKEEYRFLFEQLGSIDELENTFEDLLLEEE